MQLKKRILLIFLSTFICLLFFNNTVSAQEKTLLPEVGVKPPLENRGLWDHWCTMYDKTRNEVIHKGKEIGATETRKTIDLNKQMVNWIKSN